MPRNCWPPVSYGFYVQVPYYVILLFISVPINGRLMLQLLFSIIIYIEKTVNTIISQKIQCKNMTSQGTKQGGKNYMPQLENNHL